MIEKTNNSINLYDFDGTIYKGHSSIDFYLFALAKYPILLKYAPDNLIDLYKIKKHIINLQYSTKNYCDFLKYIDDIDALVAEFWKKNKHKIKDWYKEAHDETDVIITASPEFLVRPICEELGIKNLIASKIDKHTGEVDGKFCFNGEKINLFNRYYPGANVDSCYTDNVIHDAPLLSLAKNKYRVKGNKITRI